MSSPGKRKRQELMETDSDGGLNDDSIIRHEEQSKRNLSMPPRSYRPHYSKVMRVGEFRDKCQELVKRFESALGSFEDGEWDPLDIHVDDISFMAAFRNWRLTKHPAKMPKSRANCSSQPADAVASTWSNSNTEESLEEDEPPSLLHSIAVADMCAPGAQLEQTAKPTKGPGSGRAAACPHEPMSIQAEVIQSFNELVPHLGSVCDFLMRGCANDKYRKSVESLLKKIATYVAKHEHRDAEGVSHTVLTTEPQQINNDDILNVVTAEQLALPLRLGRQGNLGSAVDGKDKECEEDTPICKPVTVDALRPHSDVVIVLQVYKAAWRNCQAINTHDLGWQVTEIHALGSHQLHQVRDLIRCPADRNLGSVRRSLNSAYLFIEGIFYNDMRQPGALDASKEIRNFCRKHKTGWPLDPEHPDDWHFEVADIDSVTMEQLKMRVGNKPLYLFCHQACCEHLVSIADVRLLHANDPPQLLRHPIVAHEPRERGRKCYICRKKYSTKVTYQNRMVLYNPCFLCDECFRMLHYDEDGNVLDDYFLVFPYSHEK